MLLPWKKASLCALAILLPLAAAAQPTPMPAVTTLTPRKGYWSQRDDPMVDIAKVCPGVCIELRYATERNFTSKVVYPLRARALIRRSVAARLRRVQDALRKQGYGLKIWDAYRPAWAQDVLWKASPNAEYLAAPSRGGSYHTWGTSVDVTLVDSQGREQKMASDFDDFSVAAKYEYVGNDPAVAARMDILGTAMKNAGFGHIRDEWWHFTAGDAATFAPVDMALEEGGAN